MRAAAALLLAGAPLAAQPAGPPAAAPAPAPGPAACAPARTALVLGGGGAKGFAHLGLFRALDSAGVRPDLIVGTSIGAITGALYASGYTARQIDSLTRSLPLAGVVHGYEPRLPGVLGDAPAAAVLERRGGRFRPQTGAVQESEINALMSALMIRGNLAARGDFDRLPIPFRAVATDISNGQPVVLGAGDLARAVRASFAIPVVFQPVRIDGRLLNDGGMANNVPVAVARSLGAERVIVSTLPSEPVDASELDSPFGVAAKLVDALVRNELLPLGAQDVLVQHATEGFDLLDFGPAQSAELVKRGYAAAQRMLAAAPCVRPLGGAPRPGAPAAVTVGRVADVRAAVPRGEALVRALGLAPGRRVAADSLQARLLAVGETGRYQAVWLYPAPDSAEAGRTRFDLVPIPSPTVSLGVGAAFDGDNGGRAWAGVALPALAGGRADVGAELRAGRYQQEARAVVQTVPGEVGRTLTFPLDLRVGREDVRRFVRGGELPSAGTAEASAYAGAAGARGRLRWSAGPYGIAWYADSARAWRQSAGARLRVGTPRLAATRAEVTAVATGAFWWAGVEARHAWSRGPVGVRPYLLAAAGGRGLPLQRAFVLGGGEGFPGLRIGEGRGDRAASAGAMVERALVGPVAAELELAAGALGAVRDPAGGVREGALVGARAGVRIATPAGAIRVSEGVNSLGRHALYLRIGRWY